MRRVLVGGKAVAPMGPLFALVTFAMPTLRTSPTSSGSAAGAADAGPRSEAKSRYCSRALRRGVFTVLRSAQA